MYKSKIFAIHEEIDRIRMVVRKLLYIFLISDRSLGKNREVEDLNNVINSLDLKNMFQTLYFTENNKKQNTKPQ